MFDLLNLPEQLQLSPNNYVFTRIFVLTPYISYCELCYNTLPYSQEYYNYALM